MLQRALLFLSISTYTAHMFVANALGFVIFFQSSSRKRLANSSKFFSFCICKPSKFLQDIRKKDYYTVSKPLRNLICSTVASSCAILKRWKSFQYHCYVPTMLQSCAVKSWKAGPFGTDYGKRILMTTLKVGYNSVRIKLLSPILRVCNKKASNWPYFSFLDASEGNNYISKINHISTDSRVLSQPAFFSSPYSWILLNKKWLVTGVHISILSHGVVIGLQRYALVAFCVSFKEGDWK